MDEKQTFTFIESQKKRRVLLLSGHRYNLNLTNKGGSTLWRCSQRNECSASVTINKDENKIIRQLKEHTCKANFDKNRTDIVMDKCKKLVCQHAKPVQKIFEKEFGKVDEIEQVPDFNSKKDTLFRARRTYFNVSKTEYKNLNDVKIPEILADKFLVCEDGCNNNKILIFSTPISRKCIETLKGKMFFIDATFKATPKPFYELLSIHVDINSCDETTCIMGVIYALLPNKTQDTYERLFDLIKQHFNMDMSVIKCDYEMALINGIKKAFPNTQITGCYYHLNKAVWKKASTLGLTENRECRETVRVCSNLPLLPSQHIRECWTSIVDNAIKSEEMNIFLHYFERQWLQSLADIISCPSYYNFRTNNALEGWHRRLNTNIKSKPTFLLFLKTLRKEALWQDRKYKNILFEGNKRKKIDIMFNAKYKRELHKLEGQKVSPFEFLINIGHIKRMLGVGIARKPQLRSATSSTSSVSPKDNVEQATNPFKSVQQYRKTVEKSVLSNISERSELDESHSVHSRTTFNPQIICTCKFKKADSDSDLRKKTHKCVVRDKNLASKSILHAVGDNFLFRKTIEQFNNKKNIFEQQDFNDILQDPITNDSVIENTPPIEIRIETKKIGIAITRKCTVVSKSTTDDESNTEAIIETPTYANNRIDKCGPFSRFNAKVNNTNFDEKEDVECVNNMVDNVCADLVYNLITCEESSNEKSRTLDIENVIQVNETYPTITNNKDKSKNKTTKTSRKKTKPKGKKATKSVVQQQNEISETNVLENNVKNTVTPKNNNKKFFTDKNSSTKKKRKLYSPNDDYITKENVESTTESDNIILSKLKSNQARNIANNSTTPYKDIENKKILRKSRSLKSRGTFVKSPSPNTTESDAIFDRLVSTVENDAELVVANPKCADDVYNFNSSSEDSDFQIKRNKTDFNVSQVKRKVQEMCQNSETNISIDDSEMNLQEKGDDILVEQMLDVESIKTVSSTGIQAHIYSDEPPPAEEMLDENISPRETVDMSDTIKKHYMALQEVCNEPEQIKSSVREKKSKSSPLVLSFALTSDSGKDYDKIPFKRSSVSDMPSSDCEPPKRKKVSEIHEEMLKQLNSSVGTMSSSSKNPTVILKRIGAEELQRWLSSGDERKKSKKPRMNKPTQSPKEYNFRKKRRYVVPDYEKHLKTNSSEGKVKITRIEVKNTPKYKREPSPDKNVVNKNAQRRSIISPTVIELNLLPGNADSDTNRSKERVQTRIVSNISSDNTQSSCKRATLHLSSSEESPTPHIDKSVVEIQNTNKPGGGGYSENTSSISQWLQQDNPAETDTWAAVKDVLGEVLEKLHINFDESKQQTKKQCLDFFLGIQNQLCEHKREMEKIYKIAMQRSDKITHDFVEGLRFKLYKIIEQDRHQKQAMITILKDDVQAALDYIDRTNKQT